MIDINLVQPVQNADWSKILELKGFVPLSTPEPFKIISNILFVEDKIITLDVDTDFEAIRVFDGKTGKYLYNIGKRTETDNPAEGYNGVIDIAYNPDRKQLRLLSNGQLRLSDYDLNGKYQGSVKYDFYGSDLAYLGNDQWVVYNELYANETIGHHYLVFYNSKGEIINKALPYKKSLNGNAFDFAGYLMRSGNEVWFNAPFNDTVFSVTGTQAIPRYRMLDSITLQTGKSRDKIYGDGVSDEVFLEEGFFSNGRYVVFPFVRSSKVPLGIYDTQKNLFMDSGNLDKSVLFNKLCMSFTIFPKDASTFAMVEGSGYLQKIMKQGDRSDWEKVAPGLYDQVMNDADASGRQYLLFFGFKG
ncbi:MAG: 6-bladed beta-propeller [Saprospiraceae bacterium]|nr:6-bladed beta-propeller [Saprospiraceae bacterium]